MCGRFTFCSFASSIAFVILVAGCSSKPPYEGKSVAEFQKMLKSSDPNVQAQGALGLSRLGSEAKPAMTALIEVMKSPEPLVRQNAALALGAIGAEAKPAVPGLIEALADPEWPVRRQAALSLGQIGPAAADALPRLQQLQKDPNSLVGQAAREASAKINSPPK